MIPRAAAATIGQLARGYPVIAITGPRQSGKTTLAQALFSDKPYVSLEDLDERELAPHHRNFGKRLVKTPKLYFLDSGLAAWLAGIEQPEQLATHSLRGALFETWVVSELLKARFNRALASNLYFWRDRSGHEVDIVVEHGNRLVPVEVKSGQTIASDFFAGLEQWKKLAMPESVRSWLVYGGDQRYARLGTEVIPWRKISELLAEVAG